MDSDELKNRSKEFAHRCVKLALALPDVTLGRHIRGQLFDVVLRLHQTTGQHA